MFWGGFVIGCIVGELISFCAFALAYVAKEKHDNDDDEDK
nr:MAG TPA: Protein of unknown function (DUF3789) [Bacteriophage sp.]